MKIAIIGAGATGLTAGWKLSEKGHCVTVYEKNDRIGGLTSVVPVGDDLLEIYYHHIFTNDTVIIDVIKELGLEKDLKWYEPSNVIYINEKIYPFTSPLDLLMFKPLSLISRIRMGLMVIHAWFIKDYLAIENMTAREWIIRHGGEECYRLVWEPLLNSKFDFDSDKISATWIWNKFKLRGSSRGKNINKELLGYMDGSFIKIYNKIAERIKANKGEIRLNDGVTEISKNYDRFRVRSQSGTEEFDSVIFTASPERLSYVIKGMGRQYLDSLRKIKYKANICMILELSESLMPNYWMTVADRDIPFVLVIEHTNLVKNHKYGSHIVYLSRYLDITNELYGMDDESIKSLFISGLKKIFPDFKEEWIKKYHINRTRDAQPVVTTGYSRLIPDVETPMKGLYLTSMSQIYPEDRGQNYAILSGLEISRRFPAVEE
ncbi:amine oxidase [Thermoclostridium stercorarium subsp. stercorarium DSM 8532]|uniref:Amine oxidase n=1 Tax=Thermoclostridium stercorarium (strain ATCC 35414 / DSM 8532 / NCIMB 11754) TaxID=1121335 RepID=L7VNQ4_THES1|nr:NAD(P)/FAD-dependent oxidoreductase [Thermoclostridium stercorarium]AGC68412.1 amine oxidase [Thermoclostridium stercorarium subsp. stercorarium DSM 8532]AGI39432.1 protoporphyrinogen oxidase [Thermoclostridium stercorarium subsp. stercorarium DSM 8532]